MQVHLLTGPERRRIWSDEQKRAIVSAAFAPGARVADVARQADINSGLIYRWRKDFLQPVPGFFPGFTEVVVAPNSDLTDAPTESHNSAIDVLIGETIRARIPLSASPDLAAAVVKALTCR